MSRVLQVFRLYKYIGMRSEEVALPAKQQTSHSDQEQVVVSVEMQFWSLFCPRSATETCPLDMVAATARERHHGVLLMRHGI